MALELYRTFNCIDYLESEPPTPAFKIKVREPLQNREKLLTVPLDTGFAGYLLTTSEIYNEIGLAELPSEEFGVYRTMAGPLILKRAHITIILSGIEIESYIETPLYGGGKLLVGRRILSQFNLALLGKTSKCCMLEPQNRSRCGSL